MSKYSELAKRWLAVSHDHRNHPTVTELARDSVAALRELEAVNENLAAMLRLEERNSEGLGAEWDRLCEAIARAISLLESEALDADYKALGCLIEALAGRESDG